MKKLTCITVSNQTSQTTRIHVYATENDQNLHGIKFKNQSMITQYGMRIHIINKQNT